MKKGQRMPFEDALALTPDDLPDGAYWALAHEIAGLEYGDGFDEIAPDDTENGKPKDCARKHKSYCECGRGFWGRARLRQHRKDAHGQEKPR